MTVAVTRPASRWMADAERYDQWFDRPWGRYAFGVERENVLAAAGDLSGLVVADIGCGTGRLTQTFECHAGQVIGLDLDPAMLAIAAGRTDAALLVGDGHDLPLLDASVDLAVAVTVCEFTADPGEVVAELARITRPGGRVVVGALDRHSPWGMLNRRRLTEPPWSTARFLSPQALRRIGEPQGAVTVRPALYPPAALPFVPAWGPVVERLGRRLTPQWGAFNVLSIVIDPNRQD